MADTKKKPKGRTFKRRLKAVLRRSNIFWSNPARKTARNELYKQEQETENSLFKFVLAMNAGATIATLALIGQIYPKLSPEQLVEIGKAVAYFVTALKAIGIALVSKWLMHAGTAVIIGYVAYIARAAYLILVFYSLYLFITGTQAVFDAILKAF